MVNPKGRPKVENPNKIIKTIRLSEEMIKRIENYGEKITCLLAKSLDKH